MSRTKSTGLIKAAVRPKSDAGHAGWRPRVDMAASMQINGLRPAVAPVKPEPKPKPIEPPPLCECDPRLPARDRCNKSWVRCNAGIRARRHLEPVFPTAAEAREIHEDRERTERLDPQETPRRMTQPGLFDALGVKV